jgi:hypothetical protein
MTAGFVVFLTVTALGAAGGVVSVRRTKTALGTVMAVKEAIVAAGSAGSYAAVCVWLGYGALPQLLAGLVSCIVLLAGWRWVPSLAALVSGRH